jgi:hypothetical protein
MNERPYLTDKLVAIRKDHDKQRSAILRAWPYLSSLWALAATFEAGAVGRAASTDIDTGGLRIQVWLAKEDSFKSATSLLAALIEQGWKETRVANEGSSRDYFFEQEGIKLAVWVWPHSSSGLCKRVMVGVETYAKYKLVCEDEKAQVTP